MIVDQQVHRGVEGRQVVFEAAEFSAQRGNAAFVGGDGGEARVVEIAFRRMTAGFERFAEAVNSAALAGAAA